MSDVSSSFTNTGSTIFLTSLTAADAVIITVPGAYTFSLGYFCTIESESFPVGILIPNSQVKSLTASTASYKRASSPLFFEGHIQLALKETDFSPSSNGAQTKLVNASAIANLLPFLGLMSEATGAWPKAVAIPFSPL